jgi:hypothetical protein
MAFLPRHDSPSSSNIHGQSPPARNLAGKTAKLSTYLRKVRPVNKLRDINSFGGTSKARQGLLSCLSHPQVITGGTFLLSVVMCIQVELRRCNGQTFGSHLTTKTPNHIAAFVKYY